MFSLNHYINGELVEGQGKPIAVVCPGTGEVVGQINAVGADQAQQALEAARDAFPAWSALPLETRGEWMLKLADAISAEQDKLAEIMAYETGKFFNNAYGEVGGVPRSLHYFLNQARMHYDETIRDPQERTLFLSVRAPP